MSTSRRNRVLLDVGAHFGETAQAAVDPKWSFSRIHCFEPAPQCWERLQALDDARINLCRFGLWREDAQIEIHDPGEIGASIHAGKALTAQSTLCEFRDAGAWFQETIDPGDEVLVKLNVEGSEVDIIRRWNETGCLAQIKHLVVHFDVRKVPGMAAEALEGERILNSSDLAWKSAEDILYGRNATEKTSNWLRFCLGGTADKVAAAHLKRLEFAARTRVYYWRNGTARH